MAISVAGAVVTYNRISDLKLNIDALMKQGTFLSHIFIIDNASTDGTKEYCENLQSSSPLPITYVRLKENTGGAGGFCEAVKRGRTTGCDFVWLMDDDGRPTRDDTLSRLVEHAEHVYELNKLIMINPLVLFDSETLSFPLYGINQKNEIINQAKDGIFDKSITPFNGTLISKELIDAIGTPNADFFIGYDETDYYLRARAKGAYIATVCESLYYHPKSSESARIVHFLGKTIIPSDRKPWREYYATRNHVFVSHRDEGNLACLAFLAKRIVEVAYRKDNRLQVFKAVFKGYSDGMHARMGKRVDPS